MTKTQKTRRKRYKLKPVEVPENWRELATLSIPQAGKLLAGLCRNSSYEAAKQGQIPYITLGGKLRAPVPRLIRLLEGQEAA